MTKGNESDEVRMGSAEALHDAYAQPLYRYAWSLLGGDIPGTPEDPVTEAVHEGLVAGVVLEPELADPSDRGPWLYALVRAACQRRGFAHTCPYTRLATTPTEAPVARMFSRLPASHRELVELNLRHALPGTAIARVLGLEADMCGELSRSAIRRAAEGLHRLPAGEENTPAEEPQEGNRSDTADPTWRAQVHQVSTALALLRPPGAPPGLRERVVHTCTSPETAGERKKIAATMRPLTTAGYPVHRARPVGTPTGTLEDEETVLLAPPVTPRPLPEDRLTTHDHPVHENVRAPLPAPDHDPATEALRERRRWPLPALSGLATVAAVLGLWWWAGAMGLPSTTIDTGPSEVGRAQEGSEVEITDEPTERMGDEPARPGNAPTPETGEEQPLEVPQGPGTDQDTGQERETGPDRAQEPEPAPDRPRTPRGEDEDVIVRPHDPEHDETPGEEPGGEEPESGDSDGLLDDLLGLLFGDE